MPSKYDYLQEADIQIKIIEEAANKLSDIGKKEDIPAIYRNTRRILASTKMLKIDISEAVNFKT
jgi:hypothetical protein